MANENGWGDGSVNNNIGWGKGAINNSIGWGSSQLTSWSGATDIDGGNAPTNTVAPAITGTAQEGQTLTCSTGTWTGSPTYTYQWKRNGNNITSATNSTYTLVTADVSQSIKCTVTATNILGSANADSNTVTPTASTDADAQAFITAAGITDNTQKSAINQLVVDLKGYSIWTKFKAIYPIVGGSASSHAVNLKTPGTYNLTFATGMTHSSTGMAPDGAGAYANTALNASTVLTQYSTHLSYYSRTSTQDSDELIMGVGKDDGTLNQSLYARRTNDTAAFDSGSTTSNNRITYSNTDGTGLYLGSVTAQTSRKAYKNGVLKGSNTNSLVQSLPNANVFICCYNAYDVLGANYFTNKQCAFASIGNGLTDTEAANFYTAVQAYQTTLSRQV